MNGSRILLATVVGLVVASAGAHADETNPDPAEVQEQVARDAINALRGASRELRKLVREIERSGDGGPREGEYAAWIGDARDRIDRLAQRWVSNFDLYRRDFPREALLADPERHAYAVEWLGDINGSLSAQADELRGELLERNASFGPDVPASRIDAARAVIEQLRT